MEISNPLFASSIAHRNVNVKSFLQISENFFWQREKDHTDSQESPKAQKPKVQKPKVQKPLIRMIRNRERAKAKKSQISQFFDWQPRIF